jgi:hypothetical protein
MRRRVRRISSVLNRYSRDCWMNPQNAMEPPDPSLQSAGPSLGVVDVGGEPLWEACEGGICERGRSGRQVREALGLRVMVRWLVIRGMVAHPVTTC